MRFALLGFLLVVSPSSAFALDQSVHESMSQSTCETAGLPHSFCERVGTEAYNVDSYEWSTPEAHAQIGWGATGTACTAVNAAFERMRTLGADIRLSLAKLAGTTNKDLAIHIATQIGRVLHTIQDDCAHHGMANPQHAWASLTDACTGSRTSPDLTPEAALCAQAGSTTVMQSVVAQVKAANVSNAQLDGISEGWTHWPGRGDVCAFLKKDTLLWDGSDGRWENTVVTPMIRDQLTHAINVDERTLVDACSSDVHLQSLHPDPTVSVANKPAMCWKVSTYCLGKADAPGEPPPWDDDLPADGQAAGCSAGGAGSPTALVLTLLGLVLATRRRRARTTSS